MSDNTFLDYLDVILPTHLEQDELKQLAEQDFNNNPMFIQNTTNRMSDELILTDNGFEQINENLFKKDNQYYEIANYSYDVWDLNFAGETVEIKQINL